MGSIRLNTAVILLAIYLGIHNGHLAILKDGHADPVRTFPYAADIYPETDRQALQSGIPIVSRRELNKLLEDYLS